MEEDLSALIDGELDPDAADRCLQRLCSKDDLLEAWRLYQLIGDQLRGGLLPGSALSSRVAERLHRESLRLGGSSAPPPTAGHFAY